MTPGHSFGKPSLGKDKTSEEGRPVPSKSLRPVHSNPTWSNSLGRFDSFSAIETQSAVAQWFNRALILFLFLFAISLPHSIAAAQISLCVGIILWVARDVLMRQFNFARTPIDLPLVCFAGLTVLSSIFSVEPLISLPKLKGLLLFGTIYLLATNLRSRGVRFLVGLLIASSLLGVGFSLMEKLRGRGMIITTIDADSPLAQSDLRPGDVIWMIGRHRVFSPEALADVIRRERVGKQLEIEALHAGDPVPVKLIVTDELKARTNPLGITANGRSRQFRVSGFSRQFLTYAEQMQMLALLAYGGILASLAANLRQKRKRGSGLWIQLYAGLFILFGLALVLTASRAVIAAAIGALLIVSVSVGRRALLIALMAALVLGALGVYVTGSARRQTATRFSDDSTARRISYMRAGLRVIPQHPLLGVGMDAHKRHWQEWGFPGDYVTHTHSTPIQIAMDRGLPALACYGWLIAAMLIVAWRGFKRANETGNAFNASLTLGGLGAVIGFSLSSLTNYNFGDSEALMMLLFIIGLLLAANRNDQIATGLDGFSQ